MTYYFEVHISIRMKCKHVLSAHCAEKDVYFFIYVLYTDMFTRIFLCAIQFSCTEGHSDINLLHVNPFHCSVIFNININYSCCELLCQVNFACQRNLCTLMLWELFKVIYFITFVELFIESLINCAPRSVLLIDTKSYPILLQLFYSQNSVLSKQKSICSRVAVEQAIKGKMYHLEIYQLGWSLLWGECHSTQRDRHVYFSLKHNEILRSKIIFEKISKRFCMLCVFFSSFISLI